MWVIIPMTATTTKPQPHRQSRFDLRVSSLLFIILIDISTKIKPTHIVKASPEKIQRSRVISSLQKQPIYFAFKRLHSSATVARYQLVCQTLFPQLEHLINPNLGDEVGDVGDEN